MKKYISLTLMAAAFSMAVKAQSSGKDSLLSVIVKDVCTELGKKDLSSITREELNTQLGLVLLAAIGSHSEGIQKYYNSGVSEQLLNEMGSEVGMKLATECPTFVKLVSEKKELFQDTDSEEKNATKTISGTLQKIVPGDFTYLQVKDPDGKMVKIWWMEPFDGAEKVSDKLLNKPVMVSYSSKKAYNAQLKEYTEVNIATKLQVIQ